MTTAIGPGTLLVCLDAATKNGGKWPPGCALTQGAIYRCESLSDWADGYVAGKCLRCGQCPKGIELVGKSFPRVGKVLYCTGRFRPLNNGDTTLVEEERDEDLSVQSPQSVLA